MHSQNVNTLCLPHWQIPLCICLISIFGPLPASNRQLSIVSPERVASWQFGPHICYLKSPNHKYFWLFATAAALKKGGGGYFFQRPVYKTIKSLARCASSMADSTFLKSFLSNQWAKRVFSAVCCPGIFGNISTCQTVKKKVGRPWQKCAQMCNDSWRWKQQDESFPSGLVGRRNHLSSKQLLEGLSYSCRLNTSCSKSMHTNKHASKKYGTVLVPPCQNYQNLLVLTLQHSNQHQFRSNADISLSLVTGCSQRLGRRGLTIPSFSFPRPQRSNGSTQGNEHWPTFPNGPF